MKVAVTGGGTGGHTLPVLAVVNNLRKIDPESEIFFVGSRSGIESQLIPKIGIRYYGITVGKFRRYHKSKLLNLIDPSTLVKNARDFFRFLSGIREAMVVLRHEKPDVVFAKGGFVSLPVGYAAKWLKIPVVIHESDTVMGLANRMMAKFATKVAVTFPAARYPEIPTEKIVETGCPVREDLAGVDRREALRELGLSERLKTILIIGGSQGALFINEKILEIISDLLEEVQVIWVVGERDSDLVDYRLKELAENKRQKLRTFGFVTSEMASLYSAADLVISRPGSNILFELAFLGKPAILIPPSESIAGGHQFENARYFSRNGGSLVIKQADVTAKKLRDHILRLINDENELLFMGEKMSGLSPKNAASNLAALILEVGEEAIEQARKNQK